MKPLDTDKTYLITGGAGFIGFSLSRELLKKGARKQYSYHRHR